jgi:hypothetical protein
MKVARLLERNVDNFVRVSRTTLYIAAGWYVIGVGH